MHFTSNLIRFIEFDRLVSQHKLFYDFGNRFLDMQCI